MAQSVRAVPMETFQPPIAKAYTKNITATKIGRASTRFVTTRSILSDTDRLCLAVFFFTALFTAALI